MRFLFNLAEIGVTSTWFWRCAVYFDLDELFGVFFGKRAKVFVLGTRRAIFQDIGIGSPSGYVVLH